MIASASRLDRRFPDAAAVNATRDSADSILAAIRALAPDIAARAAAMEAGRRMPIDLVSTLKSIGVFRLIVPRSHGGLEVDLPTGLKVITALARIDASVGWLATIASVGPLFAPLLPRETYDRIYRNGPDVAFAGSVQPVGTAEPVAGGFRVSGRWPFASGCQHADWMLGFCVVTEGGKPLPTEDGPIIRAVVLPARDWQIEDTWHAVGLKGTGSHHIALENKLVPTANSFDVMQSEPCVPGPLYYALRQLLPVFHGANHLGIAEGALSDLLALAKAGRRQLHAPAPMRESEAFQFELGRVAAELRAAQAFHQAQVESHWRQAQAGTLKSERLRAEATQAAIWIAQTCIRVADACFALAGGSAVYDGSTLQRRLRDLHTAGQHAEVQARHYTVAGKTLLA